MKSKTKWMIVGPAITLIGFTGFFSLLGGFTAILFAPVCGLGVGLWGYGWTVKNEIQYSIVNWLNKDD